MKEYYFHYIIEKETNRVKVVFTKEYIEADNVKTFSTEEIAFYISKRRKRENIQYENMKPFLKLEW